MKLGRERRQNLTAGGLLAGTGLFAMVHGSQFELGTLMTMGPAFIPVGLGVLMVGFGGMIAFERKIGLAAGPLPAWRQLMAIFGSVLAFAVLIERAGLVPATFALVFIMGLADTRVRLLLLLAIAASLSTFSYVVFVRLLGVPFVPIVGLG